MSARGEERTAVSGLLHGVRIVTMGGLGHGGRWYVASISGTPTD